MTHRPDLEFHRSWLPTTMTVDEQRDVIDYALSLEQQLATITKRLEEIEAEAAKCVVESTNRDTQMHNRSRQRMAQQLLIFARRDVTPIPKKSTK